MPARAEKEPGVFDRGFERRLAQLRGLAETPASGRTAPERLIRLYVETIGREPWLPSFILREVLGGDAERRARFAARFPARLAPVLLPLLALEKCAATCAGTSTPPSQFSR